jgi:hypothetical protein
MNGTKKTKRNFQITVRAVILKHCGNVIYVHMNGLLPSKTEGCCIVTARIVGILALEEREILDGKDTKV